MSGRRAALHIGLNTVQNAAARRLKRLSGADDAVAFSQATAAFTDTGPPLIQERATKAEVLARLRRWSRSGEDPLAAGDLLLVTYAGHGLQVADADGEEPDMLDETWELWDQSLTDDDIGAVLRDMAPGVAVVLVSDSCHSGTFYKLAPDENEKELDKRQAKAPELSVIDLGDEFPCGLVCVSACRDDGSAYERFGWGVLTRAMTGALSSAVGGETWEAVLADTVARVEAAGYAKQRPMVAASTTGRAVLDAPALSAPAPSPSP